MAKKRLVETLEIMIAVPDPGNGVALENMLSAWSGKRYAELSLLLSHLQFVAMTHQVHHWTTKGDPFYGDHLLFERLYNATNEDIDPMAEKAVGLGTTDNVNLSLQAQQVTELAQAHAAGLSIPSSSDLARKSLAAEVALLRAISLCTASLRESGLLTRGLDNMLAGLEDKHEGHVYLLKQRTIEAP